MTTAKRIPLLMMVSVAATLLAACSNTLTTKDNFGMTNAPDWVDAGSKLSTEQDSRLFYGVGAAMAMGDESLQITAADNRAVGELSRVLALYLNAAFQDYLTGKTTPSPSLSAAQVARQIKRATQVKHLVGVKLVTRWRNPETNIVYSLAQMNLHSVKSILKETGDVNAELTGYLAGKENAIFDRFIKEQR